MGSSKAQMDSPDEEINLYFKIIKTIAMKVKRSETIKKLKVMLYRKEGISVDVQELFFAGDHLKDGQRILDYGIPGNSTVHLVSREPSRMRLYLNMPSNEKTIELQVLKGDTIQKIKSTIQYKEGICPHDFEIYSSGRLLENHKTVASLNIQSKDTLQMISNRKDTRSIYVQTPTNGVIEVEVRLIHSVLDVKKIIESMINIRSQRMKLFINGTEEQLENSKTLACYEINEGDILTIQYPDVFQISVRTYTENTITLDVTSSSTVHDVKILLYGLMGVPVHQQRIFFNWQQLESSMNLASYSIDEDSILYMLLALGGRPDT